MSEENENPKKARPSDPKLRALASTYLKIKAGKDEKPAKPLRKMPNKIDWNSVPKTEIKIDNKRPMPGKKAKAI